MSKRYLTRKKQVFADVIMLKILGRGITLDPPGGTQIQYQVSLEEKAEGHCTHRGGGGHVTTEQGWEWSGQGSRDAGSLQREHGPASTLILAQWNRFQTLASTTAREFFVVLSHPVCGSLFYQPQDPIPSDNTAHSDWTTLSHMANLNQSLNPDKSAQVVPLSLGALAEPIMGNWAPNAGGEGSPERKTQLEIDDSWGEGAKHSRYPLHVRKEKAEEGTKLTFTCKTVTTSVHLNSALCSAAVMGIRWGEQTPLAQSRFVCIANCWTFSRSVLSPFRKVVRKDQIYVMWYKARIILCIYFPIFFLIISKNLY